MSFTREFGRNVRWDIISLQEEKEVQEVALRLFHRLMPGTFQVSDLGEVRVNRTDTTCLLLFIDKEVEVLLTQTAEKKVEIMFRSQNEKKKWFKYLKALDSAEL